MAAMIALGTSPLAPAGEAVRRLPITKYEDRVKAGLIAPAMPNIVIELGEKCGRLMNYGDGLYAGQNEIETETGIGKHE